MKRFLLVATYSVLLHAPHTVAADPIDAQLAAGEFAAALVAADHLEEGPQRDAALGRIAIAQAATGGRTAAIETLRQISGASERETAAGWCFDQPLSSSGRGGHGGGSQADFGPLIELIQSTVHAESWEEVGGPGAIDGFVGGIYVDPGGVLRQIVQDDSGQLSVLRRRRPRANSFYADADYDAQQASILRYISLPRLVREILFRRINAAPLDEAMHVLAGLRRVRYVFVYPETGDLVLAGPAGPWTLDKEGQFVALETGLPLVRLNDLVTLWRRQHEYGPSQFGCSITPTQKNLARANAFLAESSQKPLKPGEFARNRWLATIRDHVGRQPIDFFGLDARTRAARVLIEADYRMKLVGMGLEDGVPGVESYLASIRIRRGETLPPMNVLRWWFTLNYRAVTATRARDAFEIHGTGAKVLSENELLTQQGERVHTGKSDALSQQFAASFTTHFDELCVKYPIYADLRNIFDLALVVALIDAEGLEDNAGWSGETLLDNSLYPFEVSLPPREVETVINHRTLGPKHIIAGVSGGVSIDTRPLVAHAAIEVDPYGPAFNARHVVPVDLARTAWWWDGKE